MQVSTSSQTPPTVTVDNSATVVRGFSTEVRSDVPPVQQGEGVRYTRGRPADNETYSELLGSGRKRGETNGAVASDALATPAQPVDGGDQPTGKTAVKDERELESGKGAISGEKESLEAPSEKLKSEELKEEKSPTTLSAEDEALVEQLKKRDREVRLHELAHQASGGRYAGSASYDYQRGPDGRNYAVGGEVSIDVSATDNPQETIQKAKQIRAAALAPPQPSAQDRQVAQEAEQMIADAQQQLRADESAAAKAELEARNEKLRKDAEEKAAMEEAAAEKRLESNAADNKPVVAKVTVEKPVEKAKVTESSSDTENAEDAQPAEKKDKVTAREALEKILLAGQSLSVQANAAGYISPESPAGQSGLLDLVI